MKVQLTKRPEINHLTYAYSTPNNYYAKLSLINPKNYFYRASAFCSLFYTFKVISSMPHLNALPKTSPATTASRMWHSKPNENTHTHFNPFAWSVPVIPSFSIFPVTATQPVAMEKGIIEIHSELCEVGVPSHKVFCGMLR